jgi:hypothetical protein
MILMCAVCFQGADPLMRDSLNAGIFVLLGVTAAVLACFAFFFVRLAQRSAAAGPLAGPEDHDRLLEAALGRAFPTGDHPGELRA